MSLNSNEMNTKETNHSTNVTLSESRITSDSPENIVVEDTSDPIGDPISDPIGEPDHKPQIGNKSATKSVKGFAKNRIFPNKLPPIRISKTMKSVDKIKQERSRLSPIGSFEVTWNNLSYIVEKSPFGSKLFKNSMPSYRVILKCLSGSFASSELTAVMGPSGAGKTSLLACVCGKKTTGVTGDITIRGCNHIKVSIITQNDYLTDRFTLREALLFASKVKNGYNNDHEEIINNVVNSLGLEGCLDTILGDCSGGQRRKVSIALELVSSPNILILDEPTSGLDSSACYQIVDNLRELTQHKKNPMAIVATIHQPSARVFSLFNNIYVISHNGQAIYHGAPDKLVEHLAQINLSVPEFHNPADYIAEIASGEYGGECITRLATKRKQSVKPEAIDGPDPTTSHKLNQLSQTDKYPNYYHLAILVQRQLKLLVREPHLSWLRLASSLVVGFLMGKLFGHDVGQVGGCRPRLEALYSGQPTDLYKNFEYEHKTLTENLGSIFFNITFLLFSGIMPMIMVFPKEFNVLIKQYSNGWYSSFTYFLSKVLTDLPIAMLANAIYLTIWYILSAQIWDFWRYALVLAIGLQVIMIGQSIGMICSAMSPTDPVSAGYLGISSATPFLLLAGFLVRSKRIPMYLRPLTGLSFTKYAFESSVIALYGYERCWYPDINQTVVMPPWLNVFKQTVASMANTNNDDRLDSSADKEEQALNDVLSLISGTTISANHNQLKYQSLVMSEFEFTDDMLPYNCLILGIMSLLMLATAYIVFVWKLRKN